MKRGVLTLRATRGPDLQEVRSRRSQLHRLLLVIVVLLVAAVVLFSIAAEQLLHRALPFVGIVATRAGFAAVMLLFAFYVWRRERALSRAERALVEGRVLAAALSNRMHELSAVSEAGRAVSAVLSEKQVMQVILDSVRDLLDATEASVMLLDPETNVLRLAAGWGIDEEVTRGTAVMVGEGIAGWVAESLEPVILNGDVRDPRFRGFVPKDRPVRSAMSAPLRAGSTTVGVINVSVSGGGREYTEHDLRALTDFAEHAGAAIANARLFERERQASSELAALEQQRRDFLATVTHDLKTPLTSILGYVKLLRRMDDSLDSEQAQAFTSVIERQGQRILEMVEQLVEASKLEAGAPALARERLDLGRIIDEQVLAVGGLLGGRSVDVGLPDALPPMYGDPQAVEHILMNLLENAVKYTPDGSSITVEVTPADGEVQVSVTDDGPGIPEDELPRVFDRYRQATERTERGSVGLGLYIVRNLAEAHGGRAWAENAPGKGARITFTLPVRAERKPAEV
ncbi:MAG TPA: ATP-binding protein [Actinomycetota bacterium]|nr:ATP-binding protein [Actinomycetota bacterium]